MPCGIGRKAKKTGLLLSRSQADRDDAARIGKLDAALPALERWIGQSEKPVCAVQASNVLYRMGEAARPALPAVHAAMERDAGGAYGGRMLGSILDVLEGRTPAA